MSKDLLSPEMFFGLREIKIDNLTTIKNGPRTLLLRGDADRYDKRSWYLILLLVLVVVVEEKVP